MKSQQEKNSFYVTLGCIGLGAVSRLLPHPPNVTPIAAMALLGGAYLDRRQAIFFPLAALFISDLFLGFYSTLPFVYASFLATAFIGQRLRENRGAGRDIAAQHCGEGSPTSSRSANKVLGACLASSCLFFIVTNAGTWLMQDLYPHTIPGLAACYTAAIPFFRNEILGNLWFTAVLFGLEHVSLRWLFGHAAEAGALPIGR